MRLLAILVLVLFVAAGIVIGALNADLVNYDFAFARIEFPKGAALLCALLVGWLLGGVTAWLGSGGRRGKRQRGTGKKPSAAP
jgi:putative membrane protein